MCIPCSRESWYFPIKKHDKILLPWAQHRPAPKRNDADKRKPASITSSKHILRDGIFHMYVSYFEWFIFTVVAMLQAVANRCVSNHILQEIMLLKTHDRDFNRVYILCVPCANSLMWMNIPLAFSDSQAYNTLHTAHTTTPINKQDIYI